MQWLASSSARARTRRQRARLGSIRRPSASPASFAVVAPIFTAWQKAYTLGTRPPTKQEVIDEQTAQLDELTAQHEAKLREINDATTELATVASKASARVTKAQQRAGTVRRINRTVWRVMLEDMRSDLASAAAEDVEALKEQIRIRVLGLG